MCFSLSLKHLRRGLCAAILLLLACSTAAAQNRNVTVDDQPTAEQRLGEVKTLRQAGRLDQAVELMQELIEGSRFKLVALGEGSYTDAERWCRQQLLIDGALRSAYRSRYTAQAERALAQALESESSMDALQEVARRYTVTRPGLDAGLRVVGMLLESGQASSASSLLDALDRHPDRDQVVARLLLLRGAAAAYTYELDVYEDAAEQLRAAGREGLAAELSAIRTSITTRQGADRPALADVGEQPQSLSNPIWDQPLSEASNARAWQLSDVLTLPQMTASLLLINNGRQVVALDRASGQQAWVYPASDADEVSNTKFGRRWYDGRTVAYGSGMASAVLGECFGITEARNPYVTPNKLVCIDPQTGQLKWERLSGAVRDDEPTLDQNQRVGRINLQHTHFVGSPVIARGKVLALLRRTTAQNTQTQSLWLLCFDGEDGSMLWYRHVSQLTLSSSRESNKTTPQIALDGETAYVSDSIATVAAITVQTGDYRWLRVLPVGYGTTQRLTVKTRGPLSPPVMTRAGLLVGLSLSREPMMLLDPDDGSVLQTFDEHPVLSDARYIIEAQGGAVVVSFGSISFWDAGKAEVAWTYELGENEHTVGRGDATRRYIVMPTNQRVLVLDRDKGTLIAASDAADGNTIGSTIIARGGELFAIGESRVSLYATWESVFDRLVARVKQAPDDPSGGIALASLALKQPGMDEAVIEGVEFALAATELYPPSRAPAIRERVFDQLRELVQIAQEPDIRVALFERMALVSQTPQQEVQYHLDSGLFYATRGEIDRAIRHFHAVLSEPAFASEPYQVNGLTRPAGRIAQDEVRELIETHGRAIYARYDALAKAWLEEIGDRGELDAAAMIRIARRYPLSIGTVEVLLDAARLSQKEGKSRDAISLYQQAIARSTAADLRPLAVGSLLACYIDSDRFDHASQLIERESARSVSSMPIDPKTDLPASLDRWRERVEEAKADRIREQSLGETIGPARLIDGTLVTYATHTKQPLQSRRLYVRSAQGALLSYDVSDLTKARWRYDQLTAEDQLYLLADDADQVLLFSPQRGVIAMDAGTGELQWSTALPRQDEAKQARQQFAADEPVIQRLLFRAVGAVVCIGDRDTAELLAINRTSGALLWRTELPMSRLAAIDADQWSVVAAGPAGQANQVRSGRVTHLDLFSGERVNPTLEETIDLTPRTIQLARGGVTVVGATGVCEIDFTSGRTAWKRRIAGATLTSDAEGTDRSFVVAAADGMVYAIDRNNQGRPAEQILLRGATDPTTVVVKRGGSEQVFAFGALGLLCFGGDARVAWHATPVSDPSQPLRLLIGESHAALITRAFSSETSDAELFISLYRREGGLLIDHSRLPSVKGAVIAEQAQLIGGSIVLPVGSTTLIIGSNGS